MGPGKLTMTIKLFSPENNRNRISYSSWAQSLDSPKLDFEPISTPTNVQRCIYHFLSKQTSGPTIWKGKMFMSNLLSPEGGPINLAEMGATTIACYSGSFSSLMPQISETKMSSNSQLVLERIILGAVDVFEQRHQEWMPWVLRKVPETENKWTLRIRNASLEFQDHDTQKLRTFLNDQLNFYQRHGTFSPR